VQVDTLVDDAIVLAKTGITPSSTFRRDYSFFLAPSGTTVYNVRHRPTVHDAHSLRAFLCDTGKLMCTGLLAS
jgi:hypothetical protein